MFVVGLIVISLFLLMNRYFVRCINWSRSGVILEEVSWLMRRVSLMICVISLVLCILICYSSILSLMIMSLSGVLIVSVVFLVGWMFIGVAVSLLRISRGWV